MQLFIRFLLYCGRDRFGRCATVCLCLSGVASTHFWGGRLAIKADKIEGRSFAFEGQKFRRLLSRKRKAALHAAAASFVRRCILTVISGQKGGRRGERPNAQTATVLPNNITRNRIAPSFKDSPRKPLRRLPKKCGVNRERNVSPVRNASER